jgi:hypothetical protein
MPKDRAKIYYAIEWTDRDGRRPFISWSVRRVGTIRVMDRGLHQAALVRAAQKLRLLARVSGGERSAHD